ncbi:MAG: recombinase family protein [Clostridium sp.]|nr:recombinase family protein [Clostridium sp.]
MLKKNDVKVISATESISSGAEGILLESMLEGYAEYYSAELAEKINRGLTENALKCKYNGGTVALGFTIDENQNYQINPTTAPIVREIFDDYIADMTQSEIKDLLAVNKKAPSRHKAVEDYLLQNFIVASVCYLW